MSDSGWIAFDLDGTLAFYDGWGDGSVGPPIPGTVALAKKYIEDGQDVRILTARVSSMAGTDGAYEQRGKIKAWCLEHLGKELPVQSEKDFDMLVLYDDRAIQVVKNTGQIVQ